MCYVTILDVFLWCHLTVCDLCSLVCVWFGTIVSIWFFPVIVYIYICVCKFIFVFLLSSFIVVFTRCWHVAIRCTFVSDFLCFVPCILWIWVTFHMFMICHHSMLILVRCWCSKIFQIAWEIDDGRAQRADGTVTLGASGLRNQTYRVPCSWSQRELHELQELDAWRNPPWKILQDRGRSLRLLYLFFW